MKKTEDTPWIIEPLSRDLARAEDEIAQCIRMFSDVKWDSERVPFHVFRADTIGLLQDTVDLGYVLTARRKRGDRAIAGFARVTATQIPSAHWLHELVVSPRVQLRGLGFAFMQAIRGESRKRGACRLYFTYDLFEGRNGHLYLAKCGALAIRVFPNLYGNFKGTAQPVVKSHRFMMEWDLRNSRRATLNPEELAAAAVVTRAVELKGRRRVRVEIPFELAALQHREIGRWQERQYPVLESAINRKGYRAVFLQTVPEQRRNFLVLEKP
ncbi:MAG: GNAT family N-acetyltransferase [Lentisphaerae bacterium]|nr:GNAT family N-acetyltransferase [Lentisphaerota bacterium]